MSNNIKHKLIKTISILTLGTLLTGCYFSTDDVKEVVVEVIDKSNYTVRDVSMRYVSSNKEVYLLKVKGNTETNMTVNKSVYDSVNIGDNIVVFIHYNKYGDAFDISFKQIVE